jgi:hypothetical protein
VKIGNLAFLDLLRIPGFPIDDAPRFVTLRLLEDRGPEKRARWPVSSCSSEHKLEFVAIAKLASQLAPGTPLFAGGTKMQSRLFGVVIALAIAPSVSADTLLAHAGPANNGGSPNWAMFFDLTAAANPISVTGLTTANTGAAGAAFSVEIFTRAGTALGGPVGAGPGSSPAGWTSLGIAPATQGAVASGVSLLIDIPDIAVAAGTTVGVAMRFTTVGPRYFGTGTPALSVFSDSNLTLTTGDARSAPFTTSGTFFTSRAMVGQLEYTVVPAPGVLALVGLAGLAAGPRRRAG